MILLERGDLRDRLLRLAGRRDLHRTTLAMDDAGQRVSRYLLRQLLVNGCCGLPIGLGLVVIGIPNAALWGIFATLLRFVPYLGILIAACFPLALAVAVDPGWMLLVWVCLLYLGVELVVAYLLEPWVYAASTGLSPVALDNGGDFLDPAMGADRVTFVDSPNSLSRGTRSSRAAARVSRVVARRHAGSCTR